MKHLRRALASVLSICLITLSPGLGTYHAMANVVGNAASAIKVGPIGSGAAGAGFKVPGTVGAGADILPVRLNLNAGVLPTISSDLGATESHVASSVKVVPAAQFRTAVVAQTPNGIKAPQSVNVWDRAPPAAEGQVKEKRSLLQTLRQPLPKFGRMSGSNAKAAAHTDFLRRISSFKSRGTNGAVVPEASGFSSLRSSVFGLKASKDVMSSDEAMPDYGRRDDRRSSTDLSSLDELGNPRRETTLGPDDVYDEFGGNGRDDSGFFGFIPLMLAGSSIFIAPLLGSLSLPIMIAGYLGVVLPSLVLHEMGHAWVADKLGDPSARLAGRMSFSPKNLWNHLNKELSFSFFGRRITIPLGLSFVMPLGMLTISTLFFGMPILFGGARPVMVNATNLASPARGRSAARGMGIVALAGPAVNLGIAALSGLAHFGLLAAGVGAAFLPILAFSIWLNVFLAVFNLLPFAPLDGHHVGRAFLADTLGRPDWASKIYGTPEGMMGPAARAINIYGLIGTIIFLLSPLLLVISAITSIFLTGSTWLVTTGAAQTASAFLPALGALGLMLGNILGETPKTPGDPNGPEIQRAEEIPDATELIVRFTGAREVLSEDFHLSLVDVRAENGMAEYRSTVRRMSAQMEAAGLDKGFLERFGATPIATYKRINAATLRMPASSSAELRKALEARGFKVYENERRQIVRPIEDDPDIQEPSAEPKWGEVSMDETLKISGMDRVHEEARKRWGSAQREGWRPRLLSFLLGALGTKIAQPNIGVIDTGVEKDHRLIKPGLKAAKDVKSNGDGVDQNGHGTWVTSMVLWFAPWLKNITHYKIFGAGGGATLDDVLKGLTMAGNDKNIVISNSWGSSSGDPESPDSLLVKKLAEEGHVMVFAAGNSGYYGANSIGSPAISHYIDSKTGAPRVVAIAATDRNKAVMRFSSKGPGSRKTKSLPDYPRKPNAAEQGNNTEGAWLGGRTRAISGTSMSTPKFAGTVAMLAMLFGVTEVGRDLDRVVNALMGTLINPEGEPETSIGDGYSAPYAAYQALVKTGFVPVRRGWVRQALIWLLDSPSTRRGPPNPIPAPAPRPK